MNEITTVGIDLAKSVFAVHVVGGDGRVLLRRMIGRARLVETIANLPPSVIGMEACSGSHEWARRFQARSYGSIDGAGIRGAVSEERQERRQRRGSDL
jgi:transposase